MSTVRTIRPSKRRPAARTPSSSAPVPGTPTMTSASGSATHRRSSRGNRAKSDVLSFGWTRSDLPGASSMWTMAEARARGATLPSGASRFGAAASAGSSKAAGAPQPCWAARLRMRLTVSIRSALPSAAAASASVCRWSAASG